MPAQHAPWGNQQAWYAYLRNLLASRPAKRRSPGLNGFAARLGIGEIAAGDPAFVYYADEHFVLAQRLLDGHPIAGTATATASPTKIEAKREAKRVKLAACGDDLVAVTLMGDAVWEGVHLLAMTCEGAERLQHEVLVVCQHKKWPRLFEQHSPIYKWTAGGLPTVQC